MTSIKVECSVCGYGHKTSEHKRIQREAERQDRRDIERGRWIDRETARERKASSKPSDSTKTE